MTYLIFAVAFLIRLIYILQLKATIFYNHFLLDEAFYNGWARAMSGGKWFGDGIFDALPLYPYILGVIYKLTNNNPFAPRLAAITLSSFTCVMIYLLAKKLFHKRAGIIAGFIACFYAPFIFYSGVLVPTSYVIFFYLLSSLCFLRIRKHPKIIRFLTFGVVVGLATLVRAGILIFAPVVLIWFISTFEDKRRAIIGSVVSLLGILAILVPVTIRNYVVSGDIVFLTSHAGINFYIGNNKDADGTFNAPKGARTNIEGLKADSKTLAEKALGRSLSESEVSNYYTHKAFDFIKKNPGTFMKLFFKKALLFVNRKEIYDVADFDIRKDYIPISRFPFISFLVVGILGFAGAFIAIGRWRKIAPFYIFAITYSISILIYFVNSRYRIPLATIMIIFSGFFIWWIVERWYERRWLKLGLSGLLCVALSVLICIPTGIDTRATGYTNLGSLYIQTKQWNEAKDAFNKAIELDRDDPKPYNDMAYAYIMQDNLGEAEKYLRDALSKDIDYPYAHLNLGLLFEKTLNYTFAESEYKRSIELNPNIAQAHNNLGNIYEGTGRRKLAIKEYKKAIELDPFNAKTHHNLGIIYGRAGRLKESREQFRETLRLEPGFEPARKALEFFKDN